VLAPKPVAGDGMEADADEDSDDEPGGAGPPAPGRASDDSGGDESVVAEAVGPSIYDAVAVEWQRLRAMSAVH
jgi:hypothetical protein